MRSVSAGGTWQCVSSVQEGYDNAFGQCRRDMTMRSVSAGGI